MSTSGLVLPSFNVDIHVIVSCSGIDVLTSPRIMDVNRGSLSKRYSQNSLEHRCCSGLY